jgi:hypothetical protein
MTRTNPTYHPEIRIIHYKDAPGEIVKGIHADSQEDRAAKVQALRAAGAVLIGERE